MEAGTAKMLVVSLTLSVAVSILPAAAKKPKVSTIDPITRMNTRTPEQLMDLRLQTDRSFRR